MGLRCVREVAERLQGQLEGVFALNVYSYIEAGLNLASCLQQTKTNVGMLIQVHADSHESDGSPQRLLSF